MHAKVVDILQVTAMSPVNKHTGGVNDTAGRTEGANSFIPANTVARQLDIHTITLSKIASAYRIDVDSNIVNIGLNLKFGAQRLKVLGYSRHGLRGWEYSQKAIILMTQYAEQFPDILNAIYRNAGLDKVMLTDLFPGDTTEARKRLKKVKQWLKKTGSKSFERVPLEVEESQSI